MSVTLLAILVIVASATAVSFFTPFVRRFAIRIGAVQLGGTTHGRGQRAHDGELPNVGGIGIFLGLLLAGVIGVLALPFVREADDFAHLMPIAIGAFAMWLIGLLDDLFDVSALIRLIAQTGVATYIALSGIGIHFVTAFSSTGEYVFIPEIIGTVITVGWIVGFTNAFNFIDGLDGLSAGIAVIGAMTLLTVSLGFPDRGITVLLFALIAGAATGFLRHNSAPAKIIMGDSGAYLLGFLLSVVAIVGAVKVTAVVSLFVPVIVLGLPVLNITQVTVRRLRRGRNPGEASNDHLHDMLRQRSGSRRLPVFVLWGAACVLAFVGLVIANVPLTYAFASIGGTVALLIIPAAIRAYESRAQGSRT